MSPKIHWQNETDYHVRPLGKLVRLAAHEIGWDPRRPLRVRIYHCSQGTHEGPDGELRGTRPYGLMGWAYLNSNHMALGLPNTYRTRSYERRLVDPARIPASVVAALIWHELGHCVGLRHPDMSQEMLRALRDCRRFDAPCAAAGISLTRRLR